MMTKIEDYVISPPPSDVDIRGDIIPVADIENRTPCLRKEDYYYLRELYNLFQNDASSFKYNFESDNSFKGLLNNIFALSNISDNSSIGINWHLKEGMDASQFNGFKDISLNGAQQQLKDWLKNSNSIVVFDIPPSTTLSHRKLDADIIRKCYRFLSQDMFRQVRSISNGQLAFNYTLEEKSFEYQYPVLDENYNVYYATNTGSIVYNGFEIVLRGISDRGKYIGMHRLERNGNTGLEYYHSIAFPTSTITADVVFSSPVVEAYTLLYLHTSYSVDDWFPIIRPMTGSGLNWSVEILKRSDYDFMTSGITVPTLNEWVKTKANKIEFSVSIGQIFARFENQYFSLPPSWNWKPS